MISRLLIVNRSGTCGTASRVVNLPTVHDGSHSDVGAMAGRYQTT